MKLCLSVLVDGYFPNKVDDSICYGVNESRVNEFALSEFAWGMTLPGGGKRNSEPGHVTPNQPPTFGFIYRPIFLGN